MIQVTELYFVKSVSPVFFCCCYCFLGGFFSKENVLGKGGCTVPHF